MEKGRKIREYPIQTLPHAHNRVLSIRLARMESDRFNHNYIGTGTGSLLLGLIKLGQGTAVNVLQGMAISLENLRAEVEKITGKGPEQKLIGQPSYTPRVKKVLDLARREAKALNHTYIGTEHLLLGLLREGHGIGAQALRNCDANLEKMRMAVLEELDPNYASNENFQEKWRESSKEFLKATRSQRGQYTPRAEQTLALSAAEAERLILNYLGTEHLLFGLIALGGSGTATTFLIRQGMSLENVRIEVEKLAKKAGPDQKPAIATPRTLSEWKMLFICTLQLGRRPKGFTILILAPNIFAARTLAREKKAPPPKFSKSLKQATWSKCGLPY